MRVPRPRREVYDPSFLSAARWDSRRDSSSRSRSHTIYISISLLVAKKLHDLVVQSEITRREAVEDLLKGHLRLADFLGLRPREKET